MPNYNNSRIYAIRSISNGLTYVGSTTRTLAQRMTGHRSALKRYGDGKGHYITSYRVLEADDARDSGVVEETGDFVMSLFRPDQAIGSEDGITGAFNLQLLKSRHGGKGHSANLRFSNLSLAIVDSLDRKITTILRPHLSLSSPPPPATG